MKKVRNGEVVWTVMPNSDGYLARMKIVPFKAEMEDAWWQANTIIVKAHGRVMAANNYEKDGYRSCESNGGAIYSGEIQEVLGFATQVYRID